MADGSRHSLYAAKETAYGQTLTDPALELVRMRTTTLGLAKDSLQSEEIRSDRQITDFRLGANRVAGDINFELSYGSFDKLLENVMFGQFQTDQPAVGTDQLKAGTDRSSFCFVRHFSDLASGQYFVYKGVEINQMQLTIAANAIITGTFSVVGKSQEIVNDLSSLGTPTFPTPSTTEPLDSFTGVIKEGGVTIGVITELTLTLVNGIEPRFVVGSKDTLRPSTGRSNLTGQATAFFEDAALVSKFLDETESSIEFELPDSAGNLVKFKLPRIKYTGGQPDVNGEGPITLPLPFQALRDATEGTQLIIERTPA